MSQQATGRAQSYPVLGQIVADIQLDAQGVCGMPAERLKHWARYLWTKYPRHQHPRLYQMLGGMCLQFAEHRAYAAVQLYALAIVGATAGDAEDLQQQHAFLRAEGPGLGAKALRPPDTQSTINAMSAPTISGAGIRRRTTGSY